MDAVGFRGTVRACVCYLSSCPSGSTGFTLALLDCSWGDERSPIPWQIRRIQLWNYLLGDSYSRENLPGYASTLSWLQGHDGGIAPLNSTRVPRRVQKHHGIMLGRGHWHSSNLWRADFDGGHQKKTQEMREKSETEFFLIGLSSNRLSKYLFHTWQNSWPRWRISKAFRAIRWKPMKR